jgi:CubicO group peptidase (beta-lactamase class C family)
MTRRRFAKTVLAAGLAGLSLQSANAENAIPLKLNEPLEDIQKSVRKKMKKWLKRYQVPGLSLSLIREGTPQWHQSFGIRDLDQELPTEDTTVYEAASLTKPISGFVALSLWQESQLDLDSPLISYMDKSYEDTVPEQYRKITARHALSHSSGLPNWRTGNNPPKLRFEPGERFSYSGEGYMLLQQAVQRITGKSLDVLCQEKVFEPLNMNHSSLIWKEEFEDTLALGYGKKSGKGMKRKMPNPMAASSLISSPREYSQFVGHVLRSLKKSNGPSESVFPTMLTPQVDVQSGISWGLGWGLQDCANHKAFWHWGNNNNRYHSFVIGYPEQGLGLVVMTNSGNGLPLCRELVPEIIGGCHPALDWRMVVG